MPDSDEPYGVTYPPDLLSSLSILDSAKQHPIRALPASTFSNLHLTHLLTHPPDHVLFPFIHGLEGTNAAQNQFFASNSNQQHSSPLHPHHASTAPSLPPKYRGLIWVVCDEDLDQTDMSRGHASPSTPSTESDSESDEDEDDDDMDMDTDMCYSDTNDNDDPMMQIDASAVRIQTPGDDEGGIEVEDRPAKGVDGEEKHMHPVQHRSAAIPIHDSTQILEDASPSSESFPFVHETSLTIQQQEQARAYRSRSPSPSPSPSPAASSPATSSPATSSPAASSPGSSPGASSSSSQSPSTTLQPQSQTTPNKLVHRDPPLLTSTFRPNDLIRRVPSASPSVSFFLGSGPAISKSAGVKELGADDDDDDQYEFVPLKVPDGISLRNFGIQVVSLSLNPSCS